MSKFELYTPCGKVIGGQQEVNKNIEYVRQLEPSENWDHLFGGLGPTCCSLKWSYLPNKVVPISQMARFCRAIGTTLSDNWNHLVRSRKPLAGVTSSYLGTKVKRQESRVKSQVSRVKVEVKDKI